jgi:MOSC domain-containing protein YiiM
MDQMSYPSLVSIQVGKPRDYGSEQAADPHDKPWTSGFYKSPVSGPVFVGTTNLDGDGQADLKNHGGIDKAVLAYSADHYPLWRRELENPSFPFGAFGENLTIAGFREDSVCIGDVFSIGEVRFEVSQPRQPCWKLARRWRMNELIGMVLTTSRSGWYLRVLNEGYIESRMSVTLEDRINPQWTIWRANLVMNHSKKDIDLALELASVPRLAESWVSDLMRRAERLREHAITD